MGWGSDWEFLREMEKQAREELGALGDPHAEDFDFEPENLEFAGCAFFGDEPDGTEFQRASDTLELSMHMHCQDEHAAIRQRLAKLLEDFETVQIRQRDVEENQISVFGGCNGNGFGAVTGFANV